MASQRLLTSNIEQPFAKTSTVANCPGFRSVSCHTPYVKSLSHPKNEPRKMVFDMKKKMCIRLVLFEGSCSFSETTAKSQVLQTSREMGKQPVRDKNNVVPTPCADFRFCHVTKTNFLGLHEEEGACVESETAAHGGNVIVDVIK